MQTVISPTGGLHTDAEPHVIADSEAADLLNVSFSTPGVAKTRKGSRRANVTAAGAVFLGIFEFRKSDGTTKILVKLGTELKVATRDSSDDFTFGAAILTGMAADFKSVFLTFKDKCLIFDKAANYVYDGTNVTRLGRAAVASTIVFTSKLTGGGGLTPGTYQYRFSYYSTSLDFESELSAQLPATVSGGHNALGVDFQGTILDATKIDPVWDKIRVYRSAVGGSSLLFNQDVTADFDDETADASLGAVAVNSNYTQPPGARYAIEHLGVLFLVVDADPTLVYFSDPGEPEKVGTASQLRCGQQDGDPGLGFLALHSRLYVMKRDTVFLLIGQDASTFSFENFEAAGGTEAGRAVTSVAGIAYAFNARISCYRWRGAEVQRIGESIRPTVRALKLSVAEAEFVAGYEPVEHAVWFAVQTASSGINDRVLVYFVRTGVWSLYDHRVSVMALVQRAGGERELLLGDEDGFLTWAAEGEFEDPGTGASYSGTVQAGGDTDTIVTAATLPTTGDGLAGMLLHLRDATDGAIYTRRITSNTATNIELASALPVTPAAGADTWAVGPVHFYWQGKSLDFGSPWLKKRVRTMQVALRGAVAGEDLRARVVPDQKTLSFVERTTAADVDVVEFAVQRSGYRFQPELDYVGGMGGTTTPLVLTALRLIHDEVGVQRGAEQ